MHNISTQQIKDLANQLAQATTSEKTEELVIRIQELYEKIILLHHQDSVEKPVTTVDETAHQTPSEQKINTATEEKELSVQERIQQIMNTAPKFPPATNKPIKENPPEPENQLAGESKKEEVSAQSIAPKKDMETAVSLEEELKDAISADYAADLFENAAKIEITKKSLNDSLSQAQLQIGLNDRIAFVKHLFNGSQADFNRVLSQLNSFQSEVQAKEFIANQIKPEYNWSAKMEYEERLMVLIERKFL